MINPPPIGKFLTFQIAAELFGIEILKVREIIKLMTITKVPQTPQYILGIVNLRGKVIPVVDLRAKFGLPVVNATEETCIVVVDFKEIQIGMMVDSVTEVLNIDPNNIEPPLNWGNGFDSSFLTGIGKMKEHVILLLDIDRVLSNKEDIDIITSTSSIAV